MLLAKTHIFQHPLTPDSSDRLLIVKTPSRTIPAPVCSPIRHCTAPSSFRRRQVERHLLWLVGDASADVDTRFHRRVATHMRRVATHMPRTSTPNPIPITKPKKSCINVVIARSVDPEKYVIQTPARHRRFNVDHARVKLTPLLRCLVGCISDRRPDFNMGVNQRESSAILFRVHILAVGGFQLRNKFVAGAEEAPGPQAKPLIGDPCHKSSAN